MHLHERALSTSHGGARSAQNRQYLNGLLHRTPEATISVAQTVDDGTPCVDVSMSSTRTNRSRNRQRQWNIFNSTLGSPIHCQVSASFATSCIYLTIVQLSGAFGAFGVIEVSKARSSSHDVSPDYTVTMTLNNRRRVPLFLPRAIS